MFQEDSIGEKIVLVRRSWAVKKIQSDKSFRTIPGLGIALKQEKSVKLNTGCKLLQHAETASF